MTTVPPVDDRTRDLWNQAGIMVSTSLKPAVPDYMAHATLATILAGQIQAQAATFAALVQMDLANQIRDARKELQP